MKNIKKITSLMLLSLLILGFSSTVVKADNGQSVSLSFNSYAGHGFVDGKDNGQYYSLTSGNVTLEATESTGGFKMELRRNLPIGSVGISSKSISYGAKNYVWQIDKDSTKYWFSAYGGDKAYTQYSLKGKCMIIKYGKGVCLYVV